MTGDNPGKHGIFGFRDLIPNTYTLRFPNFHNMQSKPFWFQKPEKTYVIINLPYWRIMGEPASGSRPISPLGGTMI